MGLFLEQLGILLEFLIIDGNFLRSLIDVLTGIDPTLPQAIQDGLPLRGHILHPPPLLLKLHFEDLPLLLHLLHEVVFMGDVPQL